MLLFGCLVISDVLMTVFWSCFSVVDLAKMLGCNKAEPAFGTAGVSSVHVSRLEMIIIHPRW